MAAERHAEKDKAIKMSAEVVEVIEGYIRMDWSPGQIVGRLKIEEAVDLHHEAVYQYILSDKQTGGDLYTHLRRYSKTYGKHDGSVHKRSRNGIPNRTDIDERPDSVNAREQVGDLGS